VRRCRDTQIYVRMFLGKAAQPVDQPFGGKVRRATVMLANAPNHHLWTRQNI
jgi:hypothetical protein